MSTLPGASPAAIPLVLQPLSNNVSFRDQAYAALGAIADERERVATYVRRHQAHLLRAYDLDFLCDAILGVRRQHPPQLAAAA